MQRNPESGIHGNFACGIRNTAQEFGNSTNDWNPEFKFQWQRLKLIQSRRHRIQNPRLSLIPLQRGEPKRSLRKQPTSRDATTGFPAEKRAQKFHTDDASLPRSGQCFWLVEANFTSSTTNQKHYTDLGSDPSSVWNFWNRFSDVVSRGNQWWCREMSSADQNAIASNPGDRTPEWRIGDSRCLV